MNGDMHEPPPYRRDALEFNEPEPEEDPDERWALASHNACKGNGCEGCGWLGTQRVRQTSRALKTTKPNVEYL